MVAKALQHDGQSAVESNAGVTYSSRLKHCHPPAACMGLSKGTRSFSLEIMAVTVRSSPKLRLSMACSQGDLNHTLFRHMARLWRWHAALFRMLHEI